jgi:hypothetical protein
VKVLVLGCGPAGLMAAHGAAGACMREGVDYKIHVASKKRKSALYGCQYLHRPIPGVTPDTGEHISYQLRGHADDYREKVYGSKFLGPVSPEDLAGEHMGWDIRTTYDRLWDMWEDRVFDMEITPNSLVRVLGEADWDLVINSIPLVDLCHQGHHFGATEIWAAGDAPEIGISIQSMYRCPDNMVICNGDDSPVWYRMSRVFGRTTVEWPGDVANVPVTSAARVRKPTKNDCNCWPEIRNVGRYGTWTKGVLSHEAYFNTRSHVEIMLGVKSATAEAGA